MEDILIGLLGKITRRVQNAMKREDALRGRNLAPFEARIVTSIGNNPDCSQQAIASWLDCDKGQLARAIKKLEVSGVLKRSPDQTNWRASCLTLTSEGTVIFTELQTRRTAILKALMVDVSVEDKASLVRILSLLERRL
jgi:DNA-binding MarR family transcriptional regulator